MIKRATSCLVVLISFVALSGCQTLETPPSPQQHVAFIGRYPDKMLPLPHDKKIVLVGGCFDLVHYGHLNFFKAAKGQGDYLVVALESDELIKKCKHRVPVHTQLQRAEILSHLDIVDAVILLPSMKGYKDYLRLVGKVRPSVIAITTGDPYRVEKEKQAASIGAKVVVVIPRNAVFSTRQIVNPAYTINSPSFQKVKSISR